jgi:CRP-like cAMP-binding protein
MAFFDYPGDGSAVQTAYDATFLRGATRDDWEKLFARVGIEPFVAGQIIVEGGTPGDAFFILLDGAVEVVARGVFRKRVIARIEAGSVFGEISFLDGGIRTATIRGAEAGSMVRVTQDAFERLRAWEPALAQWIISDLGRICAQRLRRTLDRFNQPAR